MLCIHLNNPTIQIPSLKNRHFPESRTQLLKDNYSSEELAAIAFLNVTDVLRTEVYELYKNELELISYSKIGDEKFPFTYLALDNTIY